MNLHVIGKAYKKKLHVIEGTVANKLEYSDAEMLPRILAAYYVVALAASLMKHSAVCYRSEFDFKKRIPFPHKALREIPLKLLLHKCEREASLREKLYPK